jgi:hypothetical protein
VQVLSPASPRVRARVHTHDYLPRHEAERASEASETEKKREPQMVAISNYPPSPSPSIEPTPLPREGQYTFLRQPALPASLRVCSFRALRIPPAIRGTLPARCKVFDLAECALSPGTNRSSPGE